MPSVLGLFFSPAEKIGSHFLCREAVLLCLGCLPLSPVWSGPSSGGLDLALADPPTPFAVASEATGEEASEQHMLPTTSCCPVQLGWLLQTQQGGPREGVEGNP